MSAEQPTECTSPGCAERQLDTALIVDHSTGIELLRIKYPCDDFDRRYRDSKRSLEIGQREFNIGEASDEYAKKHGHSCDNQPRVIELRVVDLLNRITHLRVHDNYTFHGMNYAYCKTVYEPLSLYQYIIEGRYLGDSSLPSQLITEDKTLKEMGVAAVAVVKTFRTM